MEEVVGHAVACLFLQDLMEGLCTMREGSKANQLFIGLAYIGTRLPPTIPLEAPHLLPSSGPERSRFRERTRQ